jgi:hypothetical protein
VGATSTDQRIVNFAVHSISIATWLCTHSTKSISDKNSALSDIGPSSDIIELRGRRMTQRVLE